MCCFSEGLCGAPFEAASFHCCPEALLADPKVLKRLLYVQKLLPTVGIIEGSSKMRPRGLLRKTVLCLTLMRRPCGIKHFVRAKPSYLAELRLEQLVRSMLVEILKIITFIGL